MSRPSSLVIVCGAPGSGKSTYAAKLARERGAFILDIDTATEPIIRAALRALDRDEYDRDSDFFKHTFRTPIYEALFASAQQNLAHGDVIIAAPFTREISKPHWLEELSTRFGVKVEVHYVWCTPEIRKQRLIARAHPRDLAKFERWEEMIKYHETGAPLFEHRKIDTSSK